MTWIQTFTGRAFDLLNPDPDSIVIDDIAHHLALLNRFTGATAQPYSVAQHSVLCSLIVPRELALAALLHDAAEAYVTDVSRPLKVAMRKNTGHPVSDYDWIAARAEDAIAAKFGVSFEDPRIAEADMRMLATERVHLHNSSPRDWDLKAEPACFTVDEIRPWPWRRAECEFLSAFANLRGSKADQALAYARLAIARIA
jgi:hypothetical protein